MAAKYPSQSPDKTAMPSSGNYVKVCEAIQTMCYLSLPTIQGCVEKWHQNHQTKMQCCLTPNKCPTKKKPSKPLACQSCIEWGKAIETECYPPGKAMIQWKNVNSTLLHKDPVEVAKGFVFVIPSGQNCTDFSDFDIGGILKLMMGFVDYHGSDQDCYDKMQEVLNIRNGLSHMKIKEKMYISDQLLDVYFNEIDECIDAIKGHQQTLKADEIKDCVKQIRQSAVTTDMIERALGKLSDDLKQALEEAQATQTDQLEQFIEIQMQEQTKEIKHAVKEGTQEVVAAVANGTQEVVAAVADGNQEVVDTLRPELDMLRREINNLSTQNTCVNRENTEHSSGTGDSGAVKAFNLKACQEELQEYYLNDLSKVNLLPWVPDEIKEMESIFVDLELIKKDKSKQVLKLEKNEDLVTLGDKRILVTGDAGGGKSTVVSNIAYKWAKQDPTSPLAKFSLIFVVNIIEIQDSSASLTDLIFDQILPADSKVPKEGLQSYIRDHAENVLVLIDGIDEDSSSILKCESSEITKVMHNKMLRQSCVILTSRPDKVGDLKEHLKHYTQVQLKGFSFKNIYKYIVNFLQDKDKTEKLIVRLQEQPHILALASIPVLLVMICLLWEDQCELPQTKTQLHQRTIKYLWSRYQSKKGKDPSSDEDADDDNFQDQLKDLLNKLGQGALQGVHLDKIKVVFDEKDFGKEVCDLGCHLGILSKERLRSKLQVKTSVTFLHRVFLDFCIAVHLADLKLTKPSELNRFDGILFTATCGLIYDPCILDFWCGIHPQITSIFAKYLLQNRKLNTNMYIHIAHIFESQLSQEQYMELVSLFPSEVDLTITHELIPSVLYLLKLHKSLSKSKGFLCRLRYLKITTGFKPWLLTLLGYTTNLNSLAMVVTKSPTTPTTDIDLLFKEIASLSLEFLELRNDFCLYRFDVTNLLSLLIQRNVKICTLKLDAFQFDIKTMIRYMSTLSMSLVAFGLSGSLILNPESEIIEDKMTVIQDIMKNTSTLKKLQRLELRLFRIGRSVKYLKSVVRQLTLLSLISCDLREPHLKELFSFLKKAQKLKALNLSGIAISILSTRLLVEALQHIPALENLMLEHTGMTDESACILATCLKEMSTLQYLNLDNNPRIGPQGKEALDELTFFM